MDTSEHIAAVTITSVRFKNFKAFSDFSVSLSRFNVLVGPNNAGKSTILSSFRLLSSGLRWAKARKPELIRDPFGIKRLGYIVGSVESTVSMENIHTDLADEDTTVTFKLSNGNTLQLYFPVEGGCMMFCDGPGRMPANTIAFRAAFPISIAHVPVLGPVEHKEPLLKIETVQAGLETHRASRHFRNYWYHQPNGFDAFSGLLQDTWPALEIEKPEVQWESEPTLAMFCREERMTREIYWAGFGFQVWCQLLTHILRAVGSSVLVIDEPEIYLHPDLQRQLIHVLRASGSDIVLATHSTEILNEVEPTDLLVVEKKKRKAVRLSAAGDVQAAMTALGSNHNVQLAQLARHRRVVFVEGSDFGLIRGFARKAGFRDLANGNGLAAVRIEGFQGWEKVRSVAWGFEQVLNTKINLCVILDRDFRCEEELQFIRAELERYVAFVHVHDRKEIENYLLDGCALSKAFGRVQADRTRRDSSFKVDELNFPALLEKIVEPFREEWRGQYQAHRARYLARGRMDLASLNTETSRWFELHWNDLNSKMAIVHGKNTLSALNSYLQEVSGITLTPTRILDAVHPNDISPQLYSLLERLEKFRMVPLTSSDG